MSYIHMLPLYKDQKILLFREVWALEKVHGTSTHVTLHREDKDGAAVVRILLSSGGCSHPQFEALFDKEKLETAFLALGHEEMTVYGEGYGGSQQKMKDTYGPALRFIAFDVKTGETWLDVPDAEKAALALGLEFVPYRKIATDLAAIDAERDRPSEVAIRRGCGEDRQREGVVLRPPIEMLDAHGTRIIAKHRIDKFGERATAQKITDPAKLKILTDAEEVASEWVVPMRLTHVLDKLLSGGEKPDISQTGDVIKAMIEDVYREAKGEIVESKEVAAAIGKKTAQLFKARIKNFRQDAP